jgi:hypothetical protein
MDDILKYGLIAVGVYFGYKWLKKQKLTRGDEKLLDTDVVTPDSEYAASAGVKNVVPVSQLEFQKGVRSHPETSGKQILFDKGEKPSGLAGDQMMRFTTRKPTEGIGTMQESNLFFASAKLEQA